MQPNRQKLPKPIPTAMWFAKTQSPGAAFLFVLSACEKPQPCADHLHFGDQQGQHHQ